MATLDEGIRANTSTMPLASRLDHLDFVMRYLGGKQENVPRYAQSSSNSSSVQGQKQLVPMPVDGAARETYLKGPLMDRVASLEHRLVQLCLAKDSSTTSTSDTLSAQQPQRKTRSLLTLNTLRGKEQSAKPLRLCQNPRRNLKK